MRMRRVITLIAPLALTLSMAAGVAYAKHGDWPCRQDVQRLCPDITPGPGAFRSCIEQHAGELSPACQERIDAMKAKMVAWKQACQDDVRKFCSDVQPGHFAIVRCLRENHDSLSQSCQDQLAQFRRHHHRHHHHCDDEPTPTPAP